jgi:hypothetical protein
MNVIRLPANAGHVSQSLLLGHELLQACQTPDAIIEYAAQYAFSAREISPEILLCATQRLIGNPNALRKLIEHVSSALDAGSRPGSDIS